MPATFPTTPDPHRVEEEEREHPVYTIDFDRLIRHARRRDRTRVRRLKLIYLDLSQADFNTLITFFNARRGRGERFTFTHPLDAAVTFAARFGEQRYVARHHREAEDRYDLVLLIHEVP